jgi:hypothetical protein
LELRRAASTITSRRVLFQPETERINQHQLSHYANGIKKPRPEQRRRIVEGLHKIGRELIAVE